MPRAASRTLLLSTLLAAGCASTPAWEDCEHSVLWARCPGASTTAAPVLACREADASACYWFTGGLVPKGFLPWAAGRWATGCRFTEGHVAVGHDSYLTLPVVVAPTTAADPSLTCSGGPDGALSQPCGSAQPRYVGSASLAPTLYATIHDMNAFAGSQLAIEVVPDAAGAPHARVCLVEYSDLVAGSHCEAASVSACATGGTVTLDAYPATSTDLSLDVHATFDDGLVVDGHL